MTLEGTERVGAKRRTPLLIALWGACSALAGSCDQADLASTAVPIAVQASDDLGAPLANVELFAHGKRLSQTSALGTLRYTLRGTIGQQVALSGRCPNGFRDPEPLPPIRLRALASIGRSDAELKLQLVCRAAVRNVLIIIKTDDRANLPVWLNGEQRTRTDRSGVAHLHLRSTPGDTAWVRIGTQDNPRLQPVDPRRSFEIADRDSVFVFDQAFVTRSLPPSKRRRVTTPAHQLPIRLE